MKRSIRLPRVPLNKPIPSTPKEGETMAVKILKNIDLAVPLQLPSLVAYQPGQIVSRTLAQNKAVSVTLFAFDEGEEIGAHKSTGDAFVTCLDGVGEITIDGTQHELTEGRSLVMPAGVPHAVRGKKRCKMLLVVVF